jgi:hypothetical protein
MASRNYPASTVSGSSLTLLDNIRTNIKDQKLKLKEPYINSAPSSSSTLYMYNPNYNMTNTISTVVWSILATSIVYYVFVKL